MSAALNVPWYSGALTNKATFGVVIGQFRGACNSGFHLCVNVSAHGSSSLTFYNIMSCSVVSYNIKVTLGECVLSLACMHKKVHMAS